MEGISESEEIDRRVEELMAPEEETERKEEKSKAKDRTPVIGGGFHPVRRFKGFSRSAR